MINDLPSSPSSPPNPSGPSRAEATARPCPICRKPRREDFSPFCSSRCRDRDLARWFTDGYALAGPSVSEEDISRELGNPED